MKRTIMCFLLMLFCLGLPCVSEAVGHYEYVCKAIDVNKEMVRLSIDTDVIAMKVKDRDTDAVIGVLVHVEYINSNKLAYNYNLSYHIDKKGRMVAMNDAFNHSIDPYSKAIDSSYSTIAEAVYAKAHKYIRWRN
ncbi:MAG: hypothetical protein IKN43_03855 [Selenomonadaceae bacterium]|nr:hypothetical protein [Selenomonadaceae bacterium]